MFSRWRQLLLFLGITFGWSYGLAGLYFGFGGEWQVGKAAVITTLYTTVPGIAAILLQYFYNREPLGRIGMQFRLGVWLPFAYITVVGYIAALMAILVFGFGFEFSSTLEPVFEAARSTATPEQIAEVRARFAQSRVSAFWSEGVVKMLVAGTTINTLIAFFAELTWRGYLLRQLDAGKFWNVSLFIGALWGLWYAPLVLHGDRFPDHPVIGVPIMIVWCVLASPILVFARLKSQTILIPALMHGLLMAFGNLTFMSISGGTDIEKSAFGWVGACLLLLGNVAVHFALQDKPQKTT